MPLFDYRCAQKHIVESFAPVEKCPECGQPTYKLIGATRTNFKFADKSATKTARK